jgi:hypothetical protein
MIISFLVAVLLRGCLELICLPLPLASSLFVVLVTDEGKIQLECRIRWAPDFLSVNTVYSDWIVLATARGRLMKENICSREVLATIGGGVVCN